MNRTLSAFKKIKSPYLRYSVLGILGIFMLLVIFVLSINTGLWGSIPSKKELSNFQYQVASEVYTSDSVLIGKYYLNDRQPIVYEEFPKHLRQALVSIEDERFYEHSGVDFPSLFRVGVKTVLMGDESSGGGSTLTQQLAKNLYPRKDRNKTNIVVDKIKEMIIAKRLERLYTKEEILTQYLNTVSFGDNTFGIESAALKFFNTRTENLNLSQAATLVGMLKANYSYNPRIFPEKSRARRNLVLITMKNNGFITNEELENLLPSPLRLDYKEYDYNSGLAPYFREEVRRQMLSWTKTQNEAGNEFNLYTSGLRIYTTLNYKMQKLAEEAMVEHMAKLQKEFEKSYGQNAPWLRDNKLLTKMARRTTAYKNLEKQGLEEAQIMDSLYSVKRKMTLAGWEGDMEKEASTMDSLQHYLIKTEFYFR